MESVIGISDAIDELKDDLCSVQPTRLERIATALLPITAQAAMPLQGGELMVALEARESACDLAVAWAHSMIKRLDAAEDK